MHARSLEKMAAREYVKKTVNIRSKMEGNE